MNACRYPCTTDDVDGLGQCLCDRERDKIPVPFLKSILNGLKKQRSELRHLQLNYLDHHIFKFVPIADALCSIETAIKKLENIKKTKPKAMNEINLKLSPDEFILVVNLVKRCQYDKQLRNTTVPLYDCKNPFFLVNLVSKLSELVPDANVNSRISDDDFNSF